MTQTRKFVSSSMALLLMTSVGCAGNGLKSMFARNETAGYKTLEELEAEQENEGASTDGSKPRFASWLPFGKKTADESEVMAAADTPESEERTSTGSRWKNPFRRQEAVEADPFLTRESPEETVVAEKKKPAATKAELASDEKDLQTGPGKEPTKDKSVKTASAAEEAKPVVDQEELLVEKFEKHFERNATKPATEEDSAEDAAPLIAAGGAAKKTAPKKAPKREAVADDQLLEFEKLLTEKKAASAAKADPKNPFAEEPAAAENAEADFESVASAEAAEHEAEDSNAVESFDSLLAEAGGTPKKKAASSRGRVASKQPVAVADVTVEVEVEVADQEGLFGSPTGAEKKTESNLAGATDARNTLRSKTTDEIQWTEPKKTARIQRKPSRNNDSTEEQFAAMFVDAEAVPPASLPDTPDTGVWSSAPAFGQKSQPARRLPNNDAPRNAVKIVSSGRALPADTVVPRAVPQEALFPTPPAVEPPSETGMENGRTSDSLTTAAVASGSPAMQFSISLRTLVLLIGGIIVAALLFAPARKKPIPDHELPLHR